MLTRRFLGGMRSPEATWEIMRAKKLSVWNSLEEFWRDMGATYFDGAFFIRHNRGMPHGPDNSSWVHFYEAKKIQSHLARKARDAKPTGSGVPIGDIAKKFGCYTFLFQRICGSISKKYSVPIDVVYDEFASVPPPTANWAQEITVYHQGKEYSLEMIAKEAKLQSEKADKTKEYLEVSKLKFTMEDIRGFVALLDHDEDLVQSRAVAIILNTLDWA
jgi:hypothetical protein